MSRRRDVPKRKITPDPKHKDKLVAKFTNSIMKDGKKSVAEGIVYGAFDIIQTRFKEDPLEVFRKALDNVKPKLEVKSRRVGGATYQVPVEVPPRRQNSLGIRWLVHYARRRREPTMSMRLANEILDEAGYSVENGVRVSPDGTPVRFSLSVPTDFRTDIVDSMEMVVGFWQDLDIDVDINTEDRSLWQNNRENNAHDANVWAGDAGLMDAVHDPRWYGPLHSGESNFAIPWAQWYTSDGEDSRSIEPPQDVRDHMAMYDAVRAEPDPDVRVELMEEFLAESQEQFYAMGISLTPPGYGIVADHFRNVPASMPSSSVYNDPGPTNPEQYFIEE